MSALAGVQHRRELSRDALQQRVVLGGVALAGSLAVIMRDPRNAGAFVPCPFYATTGCYCPGCGSMRAVRAIWRGDVLAAVGYNILVIPALLWMAIWFVAPWTGRAAPSSKWGIYIGAALVTIFTVVRNLRGSPLAP